MEKELKSNNYSDLGLKFRDLNIISQKLKDKLKKKNKNIKDLNQIANGFYEMNNHNMALKNFNKALKKNSNHEITLNNLAHFYKNKGFYKKAINIYRKLNFKKKFDHDKNTKNLIVALIKNKNFKEALKLINKTNERYFFSLKLEILLRLRDKKNFKKYLDKLQGNNNIAFAAICNYGMDQFGIHSKINNFCPKPLNYISITNIKKYFNDYHLFQKKIIEYSKKKQLKPIFVEKIGQNGFEPPKELFKSSNKKILQLKRIINFEIRKYLKNYKKSKTNFIRKYPSQKKTKSWYVFQNKIGSYQPSHIHQNAWLSGVLYLKVPSKKINAGGSLTFSLRGYDYPKIKKTTNKYDFIPTSGDLAIFPSCLFHQTTKLRKNILRHIIAFDIEPV